MEIGVNMAKKKHRRSKKNKAIPVLMTAAAVAPFFIGGSWDALKAGNMKGMVQQVAYDYTGLGVWSDGSVSFNAKGPLTVATGVVGAYVGHKIANKTGMNRAIKRVTMGFFEL